jgi:hypothetical protein
MCVKVIIACKHCGDGESGVARRGYTSTDDTDSDEELVCSTTKARSEVNAAMLCDFMCPFSILPPFLHLSPPPSHTPSKMGGYNLCMWPFMHVLWACWTWLNMYYMHVQLIVSSHLHAVASGRTSQEFGKQLCNPTCCVRIQSCTSDALVLGIHAHEHDISTLHCWV